jgi:AcrR family transcriptional regulator
MARNASRPLAEEVGCALGAIYNVVSDLDDLVIEVNGRLVRLKLPEIADAASVMNAHAALLSEVATGKLTPEEAEPFSAMLAAHLRLVENVELEARMKAIEERIRTVEQSD